MDLLDLTPIFPDDDADSILARMIVWANEGLDPADSRFVDTKELSMWRIINGPDIEEKARVYDLSGHEVLAAGIIVTSFGEYLDLHGQAYGRLRNPATFAEGEVTFTGDIGTVIVAGTQVNTIVADPDVPPPVFQTTADAVIPAGGEVTVPVRATEAGALGNVGPDAITEEGTVIGGITARTNDEPTVGGTDAESDEALKDAILRRLVPTPWGNRAWYQRAALDEPGVGRATITAHVAGPGTVGVVISTASGDPNSGATVDSLKARLDPTDGLADGDAPVGHNVSVETVTRLDIDVDGTIEFDSGYDLDGDAGNVALRAVIEDAIRAYVDALAPGAQVVRQEVEAAVMGVDGVHDTDNFELNGVVGNVNPAATEVPRLDVVTLVEGVVP